MIGVSTVYRLLLNIQLLPTDKNNENHIELRA